MHRTQIYLQDTVYEQLKHKSKIIGGSISELIRRAVEKDLNKPSNNEARAFLMRCHPCKAMPQQSLNSMLTTFVVAAEF